MCLSVSSGLSRDLVACPYRVTSLTRNCPPPSDHHRALGIAPLQGPMGGRFLMSEVQFAVGVEGQGCLSVCGGLSRGLVSCLPAIADFSIISIVQTRTAYLPETVTVRYKSGEMTFRICSAVRNRSDHTEKRLANEAEGGVCLGVTSSRIHDE